ncbi:MAG: zf-HC2 domain-containing protein [Anaerolineales bacterium]|nr:zf-HC2 domain-containing protein [Anaerolineales bacterium]
MKEHISTWLDAYLDGELDASQAEQIEAHLAGCPPCQALLEQRRSLSRLLQEAPTASGLQPQEQFAAEVMLQVRARQVSRQVTRWLRLAWQFAPVALLLAWAFLHTVSILSSLLLVLPGGEQTVQGQVYPLAAALRLPWLAEAGPAGLQVDGLGLLLSSINILDWNWLTNLLALAALGLLYLGWLASWWVGHRNEV